MLNVDLKTPNLPLKIGVILSHNPFISPDEDLVKLLKEETVLPHPYVVGSEMVFALRGEKPSEFFLFLKRLDLLPRLLPEVHDLLQTAGEAPLKAMDVVILGRDADPLLRFSTLCSFLTRTKVECACTRLGLPEEYLLAGTIASRYAEEDFLEMSETKLAIVCHIIEKNFPAGMEGFLSMLVARGTKTSIAHAILERRSRLRETGLRSLEEMLDRKFKEKIQKIKSSEG